MKRNEKDSKLNKKDAKQNTQLARLSEAKQNQVRLQTAANEITCENGSLFRMLRFV
jgi:hypothetical protein